MIRYLIFIFVIFLSSCAKDDKVLERTFDYSQEIIDLSVEVQGTWDQVCIITPYSDNHIEEEILGFKFDIETKSGILLLDGITLVMAISGNQVVEYFEVPRNNIDFSSIKSGCFLKSDSKFKIINKNGWYSVQHP